MEQAANRTQHPSASSSEIPPPRMEAAAAPQMECGICFDTIAREQRAAQRCSHNFCGDCFKRYLSVRIEEQCDPFPRCPASSCHATASDALVAAHVSANLAARLRYLRGLRPARAADGRRMWCVRPGCYEPLAPANLLPPPPAPAPAPAAVAGITTFRTFDASNPLHARSPAPVGEPAAGIGAARVTPMPRPLNFRNARQLLNMFSFDGLNVESNMNGRDNEQHEHFAENEDDTSQEISVVPDAIDDVSPRIESANERRNHNDPVLLRGVRAPRPGLAPAAAAAPAAPQLAPLQSECGACGTSACMRCAAPAHEGACAAPVVSLRQQQLYARYAVGRIAPCSSCGAHVERNGGCNMMTCTRCGVVFTYRPFTSVRQVQESLAHINVHATLAPNQGEEGDAHLPIMVDPLDQFALWHMAAYHAGHVRDRMRRFAGPNLAAAAAAPQHAVAPPPQHNRGPRNAYEMANAIAPRPPNVPAMHEPVLDGTWANVDAMVPRDGSESDDEHFFNDLMEDGEHLPDQAYLDAHFEELNRGFEHHLTTRGVHVPRFGQQTVELHRRYNANRLRLATELANVENDLLPRFNAEEHNARMVGMMRRFANDDIMVQPHHADARAPRSSSADETRLPRADETRPPRAEETRPPRAEDAARSPRGARIGDLRALRQRSRRLEGTPPPLSFPRGRLEDILRPVSPRGRRGGDRSFNAHTRAIGVDDFVVPRRRLLMRARAATDLDIEYGPRAAASRAAGSRANALRPPAGPPAFMPGTRVDSPRRRGTMRRNREMRRAANSARARAEYGE